MSEEVTPTSTARPRRRRPYHVLVIDPQQEFADTLLRCTVAQSPIEVTRVETVSAARQHMAEHRVDLAVIEPRLPDGDGLQLAEELQTADRPTQTVVITETPNLDAAVAAMQAGASDYLGKWLDPVAVRHRIHGALARQTRHKAQADQLRRLRRLVRKLNQARVDVSKQVDLLCTDLVSAYHDLATQIQQQQPEAGTLGNVSAASEFVGRIGEELDLEQILRKTLEFLMEKAGPANAAVFLPATMDEYTLGGYVNYDHAADSADMLLQHLADVLAPRIAEADEPVLHITDDEQLSDWIGDDAAYLADSHVTAFACKSDGETLAVVVLFRDAEEPFPAKLMEQVEAIGPQLGERLAKVIRIHHRHLPDLEDDSDDGDDGYNAAA